MYWRFYSMLSLFNGSKLIDNYCYCCDKDIITITRWTRKIKLSWNCHDKEQHASLLNLSEKIFELKLDVLNSSYVE